jgi:hypothetical protein
MFDGLRLIDSIGVNERTIVSWFDTVTKTFNFGIFHLTEQPNYISKLSGLTEYGYLTYIGYPLEKPDEASEVYMLFLKDLLDYKNWWEEDANVYISDGFKQALESHFNVKPMEEDIGTTVRKFTLIQGELSGQSES